VSASFLIALRRRTAASASLAAALAFAPVAAHAGSLQFCDRGRDTTAAQKDTLLQFAALAKNELAASGSDVALVGRSGIDLQRFGARYSHEGVALKDSANGPWSVRQLYYACDEHKPRIFDQGMAGFLFGTDDPENGWISMVFLPSGDAGPVHDAALDDASAVRVLGATYSANAYPFSTRYENCNQWVMELLASAWGGLDPAAADARGQAQAWLQEAGYTPQTFEVPVHAFVWLVGFFSLLHNDDHPPENLADNRYVVSMPTSVEAFAHARVPGAERIEMCHAGRRVVIHRGWDEIAEGCLPGADDRVVELASD
jgi:hypothetical protein